MVKKQWILLIAALLISTGFIFSQNGVELFSDTAKSYERYLNLIETHQNYKNELMDSLDYFEKIRNKDYVLNGEDIKFINLELSKGLLLLEQSIIFYTDGEKYLKTQYDFNLDDNNKLHLFNLVFTHLKIKSYETFMVLQETVGQSIKVTNLINEENNLYRKERNSLKKISKIIISKKFRKSTIKAWNNTRGLYSNNRSDNIIRQIVSTYYYQNFLSNNEKIKESKKHFRMLVKQRRMFNAKMIIEDSERRILYFGSKIFGNFIGEFASRKGKLLNNEDFIRNSLNQLQPLDIILEKTPFRLTDVFIPGYWGHSAIYLGNETQLKNLGVWDNPFVTKYHEEIRSGCIVIEALRSDVKFNTFKHFTNIDDFALLRLIDEPDLKKKREMIIEAFAQIGKKYDFSFDVESNNTIVCSELHYIVFNQVVFNTSEILDINTISVDQVAEQGLTGGAFKIIDLYIDGIKIKKERIQELYEQLLSANGKQIKRLKKSL